MLVNYKDNLERRVLKLTADLEFPDNLTVIADISAGWCPNTKPHLSFYNSTQYRDGWSPRYPVLSYLQD